MALEITTRQPLPCSVDLPLMDELAVRQVLPSDVTDLQRQSIRVGKLELEFGQLFESRIVGDQPGLIWRGDTGRLNGVARQLRGGNVKVEGSVGDDAGRQMRAGRLEISGHAGHWLANDINGGTVVVNGNCGQFAAASRPARRRGMTGGIVVVRGSAGAGVGRRMRRGIIVVEGDACEPANEMLAGTIILGGQVTGGLGTLMKRGTIVCLQTLSEDQHPNLSRGMVCQPLVWRLIQRHLAEQNAAGRWYSSGRFQLYHANPHTESRGEIWVSCLEPIPKGV